MDEELKKMKEEVENIIGKKNKIKNFQFKMENFTINSFYITPLIIFIILIVNRPEFLYKNGQDQEKTFDFFKLITFTLLFSFVVLSIINYEKIYSLI